jgi:hypothetical protein
MDWKGLDKYDVFPSFLCDVERFLRQDFILKWLYSIFIPLYHKYVLKCGNRSGHNHLSQL